MCEPLKGKRRKDEIEWYNFSFYAVESALNWMIQAHEEKIEELINDLIKYGCQCISGDWVPVIHYKYISTKLLEINREYESIMILEEGLSDVI